MAKRTGAQTEKKYKADELIRWIGDIDREALAAIDDVRDAEALEATLFGLVASTEDMREGTRAFLDKRDPRFEGR